MFGRAHGALDLLMPRTPAGTARTSALDKADSNCDNSFASLGSRFDLLNSCQNLIVVFGAKLEIPLTVPSPSHPFQARRSAISPSKSKNGNGRDPSRDWSLESVDFKRISLPTLPGHLHSISNVVRSLFRYTYVSLTPQRFFVRHMIASITSEDMSWPAELAGKL